MEWFPLITMASLMAGALFLARKLITVRLTNSVRHEFDVKLEQLRAEIRAGEEHLNAVRSTALSALTAGQTALGERRLQAIDVIWKSTMALKSGSALVAGVR